MRRIDLYLKNVATFLIVLLICLLLFEGLLRLVWNEPGYGYPAGLHIPDDTKGYAYQPDFSGNFPSKEFSNISIDINSKGFRDEEHTYEKNGTRLLALGDSVTFGAAVRYEDAYLTQLESLTDVEIIKLGVNGYEFDQQHALFFEEGVNYNPDIVLIGVVLNDVVPTNATQLKKDLFGGFIAFPKAFIDRNCKTCKLLYFSWIGLQKDYNQQYFNSIYSLWEGASWERYKSLLLDVHKYTEEKKGDTVLVIFPLTQQFHTNQLLPQEQLKTLEEEGIVVIDLYDSLKEDYDQWYIQGDNVHLNPEGYAYVAEVIYTALDERGIV